MAQLYIDGQPKGPHLFYVQVREESTWEPRPGVHIGEIGKKMGFIGVNNGFLGLKNVRIPRTRMLMRHAQVHKDGTYVKSPAGALTYFAMVSTRCFIARNMALILAAAATISTRYSAVRRQSPIDPKYLSRFKYKVLTLSNQLCLLADCRSHKLLIMSRSS